LFRPHSSFIEEAKENKTSSFFCVHHLLYKEKPPTSNITPRTHAEYTHKNPVITMASQDNSRGGSSSSSAFSSVEHSKSTTPTSTPPSSPIFKPFDAPVGHRTSTTPTSTPPSSPIFKPFDAPVKSKTHGYALPPLDREYPEPKGEIDIQAALQRQPAAWSIQGQREANRGRAEQPQGEEAAKAKRVADLEAIKKKLLASRDSLLALPTQK
jgi:hypothetical protein